MPISEDEWNKGHLPSKLKPEIVSFLESNSSEAYSAMEILEHLKRFRDEPWGGFLTGMGSLRVIQGALSELVDEDTVESKRIEREGSSSEEYFKAK